MDPADLLDGHSVAAAVFEKVRSCPDGIGSLEVRTTKRQVA